MHLIGTEGDWYGTDLHLRWMHWMRSEVKFASRDDLQSALQADRERADEPDAAAEIAETDVRRKSYCSKARDPNPSAANALQDRRCGNGNCRNDEGRCNEGNDRN